MLNGKVILVTGAGRGIGLGIAEAILEHNGRVALTDLSSESLAAAQKDLNSRFTARQNDIFTASMDVTNEESITAAFSLTMDRYGQINGLVNNAGITRLGPNIDADAADWRAQMEVNVVGTHNCCNAFIKLVNKGAAIVNIASNAGKVGYANMAGYNASKAAVISMTRTLSTELAERDINVNAICPGGVDTPMLAEVAESVGQRINQDPHDLLKTMVPTQMGRHIQPVEIGRVTAFLLSDAARIIRGQSINADGGDTPY